MNKKRIALIAHDHKKEELVEWALFNKFRLAECDLFATNTTGSLLESALELKIVKLQSGPFGGDQQIGALITEGKIDVLIFFWDPLHPLPHDQDIKALMRVAVLWNIPIACNRATADYIFASPLFSGDYQPKVPQLKI
jgi:methylglyoxal synthase